jgi:hypothetical protein
VFGVRNATRRSGHPEVRGGTRGRAHLVAQRHGRHALERRGGDVAPHAEHPVELRAPLLHLEVQRGSERGDGVDAVLFDVFVTRKARCELRERDHRDATHVLRRARVRENRSERVDDVARRERRRRFLKKFGPGDVDGDVSVLPERPARDAYEREVRVVARLVRGAEQSARRVRLQLDAVREQRQERAALVARDKRSALHERRHERVDSVPVARREFRAQIRDAFRDVGFELQIRHF